MVVLVFRRQPNLFFCSSRKKSGKLKTAFKRDFVNVGCDIDFEGPIVHAAAVLGYEGWLAGYQMAFDTAKSKLTQNNFALAHIAGDFQLHTNVWVFTGERKPMSISHFEWGL